jgi:4-nitrophenyl phosphatase
MSRQFNLVDVQALIIDIDGTLLRGRMPMPGLRALFAFLRERQMPFVVVSNNATKTPASYQRILAGLGARVKADQILTSATATANYLGSELDGCASLYVIGELALREALGQSGFVLLDDASQPVDAVVVGGDSTLTYEKLKYAALLLQRGARFVGTNPDLLCPSEEGLVPEAGATLAALQAATGVTPIVIGKPAPVLFEMAVEKLGSDPAQTAILGDRLETDILGGQRAGLKTVLVTGGVDDEDSVQQKGIVPDLVVNSLDALVELWENESTTMRNGEARDENP